MNDSLLDFYYQKYKKYLLSAVIGIIAIGIVWQVAIPQVYSIMQVRTDSELKQAEIAKLEASLSALNSYNDANLDDNIKTATTALPASKEILAMYLAIVSASTKAEVTITTFATRIGTLYTRKGAKALDVDKKEPGDAAPALLMSLTIDATSTEEIQRFTDELHAVLPLAEVKTIDYSGTDAQYEISFYYNTVDTQTLSKQVNISALTRAEQELLEQMKVWNQQTVAPSAIPTNPPTPSP